MPADVRLDEDGDGWVSLDGPIVRVIGTDLMIDSTARREGAGGPYRRALVHGPNDTLVVNWANDYTGGVVLNDARFKVLQSEDEPQLPKVGEIGQLVVTVVTNTIDGQILSEKVTLWLCIGSPPMAVNVAFAGSRWLPLQTGEAVVGTR